jgi:hypothetical protein
MQPCSTTRTLRKQRCGKNTQKKAQREHTCKIFKKKSCSVKTLREHAPKTTHKVQREAWHTRMVNNIRTPRKKA